MLKLLFQPSKNLKAKNSKSKQSLKVKKIIQSNQLERNLRKALIIERNHRMKI
jgi:hypothetical protein